jgi:AraC-like DNA-binding protein
MRIMGKRQIGEMQPFELVIAIMVSELASLPMQDTRIPLAHGIIPIITLLFLQIVISMAELKSEAARTVFSGKPSIIIKNGKLDIQQLKHNRFNINYLFEELRLQGYYNIEDRIIHVERLLIDKLCSRIDINNNFLNAIYYILESKGTSTITDISHYTAISTRQIERIFRDYIGIPPKKCCSLVRYQNMWTDLINNNCCSFNELACKYEFSDQAHMINDFKKYHGSTPQQAVDFLKSRDKSMSHFYNTKVL